MVDNRAWMLISPNLRAQLLHCAGLPDVAAGDVWGQRHWCFIMSESKLRRCGGLLAVDPAGAAQLAVGGELLHWFDRRL